MNHQHTLDTTLTQTLVMIEENGSD
jgi:hypothetical protein